MYLSTLSDFSPFSLHIVDALSGADNAVTSPKAHIGNAWVKNLFRNLCRHKIVQFKLLRGNQVLGKKLFLG